MTLIDWPYVRRVLSPAELPTENRLLLAVFRVESCFDPNAVRYEPDFKYTWNVEANAKQLGITKATEEILQKHSWGLGQIMGGTARWLGYHGPLTGLLDPEVNARFCELYLNHLLDKHNGNQSKALAAYNMGNIKSCADSQCSNIDYVRKVMTEYHNLSKIDFNFWTGVS